MCENEGTDKKAGRQGREAGRQAEAIRPGKERRGPTWEVFDMDFLSHFWWNVMSSALS